MTAPQFVLSKIPEAVCFRREKSNVWVVAKSHEHDVGFAFGDTAEAAWQSAARHLGSDEGDEFRELLDCFTPIPPEIDMVNLPPHYRTGGIEAIDAIEAALTAEEFRGFIKGNVLKYCWREKHKGSDEDLKKAAWYLNRITSPDASSSDGNSAS
jgi:hypothetical protein